jgi:hypothetical protein
VIKPYSHPWFQETIDLFSVILVFPILEFCITGIIQYLNFEYFLTKHASHDIAYTSGYSLSHLLLVHDIAGSTHKIFFIILVTKFYCNKLGNHLLHGMDYFSILTGFLVFTYDYL